MGGKSCGKTRLGRASTYARIHLFIRVKRGAVKEGSRRPSERATHHDQLRSCSPDLRTSGAEDDDNEENKENSSKGSNKACKPGLSHLLFYIDVYIRP